MKEEKRSRSGRSLRSGAWSPLVLAVAVAGALAAAACSSADEGSLGHDNSEGVEAPPGAKPGSNDPTDPLVEVLPDPLEGLTKGADQLAKVCARGQRDKVTTSLCGN